MHDLAHSRLRDSQPLRRGDLGLAATPDVARDLQRQVAAQRLDSAGIGISVNSVLTITLANILWQVGWVFCGSPEIALGFEHEPTNARQFAVKLTFGSTQRKWIYCRCEANYRPMSGKA